MNYAATTGAANEAAMMELLAPCSQSRSIGNEVTANIFVLPEVRRKGIAQALLRAANETFPSLRYSTDLTNDGAALLNAMSLDKSKKERPKNARM